MQDNYQQQLNQLLQDLVATGQYHDQMISGLSLDSRDVKPGDLFFACKGTQQDGRQFIDEAIERGAVAIVCESENHKPRISEYKLNNKSVPLITINDMAQHISPIAGRFYADPSRDMRVIGITGTNGKTSCCQFIANALQMAGEKTGVIGTLGSGVPGDLHLNSFLHTTPSPIEIQRLLASMRQKAITTVVMEVSSHALQQYRVNGIHFDIGVFTNLTREHLDYHGDMQNYAAAKRSLFTMPGLQHAVINIDDEFGQQLVKTLHDKLNMYAYSATERHLDIPIPHLTAHQVHLDIQGITASIHTPWGDGVVHSSLIGRFNLNNLLAALATLQILGIPLQAALGYLAKIFGVPGRMEVLGGQAKPWCIIDYAHTPDALQQSLNTLREFCDGEIWCVFGCGGERDKGKRPLMGQIAENSADHVVLTDDNPRSEVPADIINEILSGMSQPGRVVVEHDRHRALEHALSCAKVGDIILVAGKGHENYQIFGTEKQPFNDKLTVQMLLNQTGMQP